MMKQVDAQWVGRMKTRSSAIFEYCRQVAAAQSERVSTGNLAEIQ